MKIQDFKTGSKVILTLNFSNRMLTGVVRAKSNSSKLLLVIFDDNRLEWLPMHLFKLLPSIETHVVNFDPTGRSY